MDETHAVYANHFEDRQSRELEEREKERDYFVHLIIKDFFFPKMKKVLLWFDDYYKKVPLSSFLAQKLNINVLFDKGLPSLDNSQATGSISVFLVTVVKSRESINICHIYIKGERKKNKKPSIPSR